MKKLMFGLVAAAAAGAMAIESANVVGYQDYPFDAEVGEFLNSIGVAFKNVGEQADWTFDSKIFERTAAANDQIILFSADDWNLVSYTFKGFDGEGQSKGWDYADANGDLSVVANFTVKKGDVLYYMPGDGISTALVSGEVESSGTKTVTFDTSEGDWIFDIVNPFPKATTLADLETFCQANDQVILFDQMAWNLVSYTFKGFNGTVSKGWDYADANGDLTVVSDAATVILKAGQGGYFMPGDTRTWTVTFNY